MVPVSRFEHASIISRFWSIWHELWLHHEMRFESGVVDHANYSDAHVNLLHVLHANTEEKHDGQQKSKREDQRRPFD